jgi:DHA2 family methylenomycin A resistance protein-like MFS transporter
MSDTIRTHSRDRSSPIDRHRSRFAQSLTLAAMSLGFALVQLDVTIVNTALPSIGRAVGGGVAELQWVVSSYTTAFAAMILTAGALGDRLGAKRTFATGFAIFTAASVGCALATGAAWLIVARAVQGVGAAILVPNSLALLNHTYIDETQRGRAVAIWAGGASIALTAGPFAGGGLIALIGWRSIFLVNLPVGLLGLWLTQRYAIETAQSRSRQLDLAGQTAAIATLGLLAATLIEIGSRGWGDSWVIGGFAAAAIAAATFLILEARAAQPMLPLSLFSNRSFSVMSGIGLLANTAFYGSIFVLSLYFQQVDHLSPFMTGLAFLPMMAVVLPANLAAPLAAERIGAPAIVAIGALVAALGCAGLIAIDPGTPYRAICPLLIAMGAGLGLLVPPLTSTMLGTVDKARSGIAAGALNATRQTGSVVGVALFGSLVGGAHDFVPGLREALLLATILLLGATGAIVAFHRSDTATRSARRSEHGRLTRSRSGQRQPDRTG